MADNTCTKVFPSITGTSNFQRQSSFSSGKRRESRRESIISHGTLPQSADINMRRRSTLRGTALGMMGPSWMRRMTIQRRKSEEPKIATKYMNTYRLEPERDEMFIPEQVKTTAENVLKNYLENVTYNESTRGTLACNIADIIKNRVKDMNIPRYRIICQVIITEEIGQGMKTASRCVWNDKTDNYACASYRNSSVAAIAMVHGVYLE